MHSSDRTRRRRTALAATLLVFATGTPAAHLGVIGPVYPITEPNLLDVILARLRQSEVSGELLGLQREVLSRTQRNLASPPPVADVVTTTQPRTHYFDPSIVVPTPITDAEGRVLVAPGTRVNPLDTVTLSQPLLFLDGRDPQQLARMRALLARHDGRLKLVLTGGTPLELSEQLARPVFYDQGGALTAKLAIRQVPALVTQEGRRLRIDEIR